MAELAHPFKISLAATTPDAGLPERGWVQMDVRWLVTRETVGATAVVFGVTTFPVGARHELHRHPNAEEVEYVIAGSGIALIHDDEVSVHAGEGLFIPRDAYHGFVNDSPEPVVMAWCYAGCASLAEAGFATYSEDVARVRASTPGREPLA